MQRLLKMSLSLLNCGYNLRHFAVAGYVEWRAATCATGTEPSSTQYCMLHNRSRASFVDQHVLRFY